MVLVVVGQTVHTGDILALAGSTGRSTGPMSIMKSAYKGLRPTPCCSCRKDEGTLPYIGRRRLFF